MSFAGLTHVAYYELLSVSPTATESEIKRAYFKLALQYHPDKNPGDQEAEEKFKRLTHVYAVLSDPERRKDYDRHGEEASDDDIEIVDGVDDGSIYTVEELEAMLGPEYTREKLVSIVADMDFSVSKNPSAVYTPEIITAELTRARDNGISDIDFSTKTIEEMPDLLGMVTKLSRLVLTDCKIKILPKDRLTGLTTLRYIDLTANSLKNFPRCFSLPSVQQLLLDHNQISKVQDEDLGYLTDLHVLTMFGNQLKTFPSIITTMKSMIKLDLECNHIKTLEFDESYFPPSFQLSIDFTVKTPSSSGTRNTPASAKRATAKRGVTSPSKAGGMFGGRLTAADIAAATGASPSSASSSSSSSGKGRLQSPNATSSTASNGKLRSPTKKVTSPTAGNRKKRKSMTDVDLGFTPAPVAQTEREGSEDETSPSKPKSKKPKLR